MNREHSSFSSTSLVHLPRRCSIGYRTGRALSKHFTLSLKQSSPSKFTEDHQIASNRRKLEQDKFFLSILHMVQFSKPIPNLLKQACAAKCGQSFELYNETTQMEFHTVLCELLEQYKNSLDDLVNYPASKPNFNSPKTYRETLLMAVGIGDTLHHLTRTAAIKKHLQALESCLDDRRQDKAEDTRLEKMVEEMVEDSDLCSVQPSALHKGDVVPLWQSYFNWLRLMVVHFEAVWILNMHINDSNFQYNGAAIKILAPPRVSQVMLTWKQLLQSDHFSQVDTGPGETTPHRSTDEIILFLDQWSLPDNDDGVSIEDILSMVTDLHKNPHASN